MKLVFRVVLLSMLAGLLQTCKTKEEEVEPVVQQVKPLLITSLDLSGALAVYMHSSHKIFKINAEKKAVEVTVSHEGGGDDFLKDFDVNEVDERYFILSSSDLQQMYFVDKNDGKAYKTKYFRLPYINSSHQIVCTDNECYYLSYDSKAQKDQLNRITNYRSEDAEIETHNVSADEVRMDKDGTVFYEDQKYGVHYFDGVTDVKVADKFVGWWQGLDGYFHGIDKEGHIFKVLKDGIAAEGAIPNSVTRISGFSFPSLNKEWGVQYMYNMYMFWNINSPFKDSKTYPGPQVSADFPSYSVQWDHVGKYFDILSSARGAFQTYRRIDLTDMSSKLVTTSRKDPAVGIFSLTEDVVVVKLQVSVDFNDNDRLAVLNPDGTMTFLFDDGEVWSEIVKF